MKKLSLILAMLVCGASVFATTPPPADDPMGPGKAWCEQHSISPKDCKAQMEKWKNATPDERAAMMKDHWSKMSPEEKKMAMEHLVMKFKSMDPDSQKAELQMLQDSMNSK